MNAEQARRLAAVAGMLVVISIFAGGFAEVYVPGKLLVASDPAATARNVAASPQLFRLSFLVYLIEAVCDVSLAVLFYVLLRPVNPTLSLLAAFFGIVSTATFATSELFYFEASIPILDPDVHKHLTADQSTLFTYSALTLYTYGSVFMAFYGQRSCAGIYSAAPCISRGGSARSYYSPGRASSSRTWSPLPCRNTTPTSFSRQCSQP